MKGLLKIAFSRMAFVALFMVLQILAIIAALVYFRDNYNLFVIFFNIVSAVVVIYIINEEGNPAFKIAWIIPILLLPIFGVPIYFMFGRGKTTERQRANIQSIQRHYGEYLKDASSHLGELEAMNADAGLEAAYLQRSAGAPLYRGTATEFYPLGDVMFPPMLEAVKQAKKFIFLEFFIVEPGELWDAMLSVLERKSAEGVDVRLIYDDMGCIMTLPARYNRRMEAAGIKCSVFRRFQPVLSGSFNNRDHRKIMVVDGRVAFTGGINLADEYINKRERFGHWLDCGVRIEGAAAESFTAMFLSMWHYIRRERDDFNDFRADPALPPVEDDGFVQPFSDTPMDDEAVGKTAYINMINRARRYVWLTTPYLVIDSEMMSALTTAAKCGVDVRIITPGIPDKWYVFAVTRSYYAALIRAGVRVYEYTPGFIHAKLAVSDGETAICGTINLDYRSLYLHYEDAAWMCGSRAVGQIKDFYDETLAKCTEITEDYCRSRSALLRLVQSLLRVFAPMM